jgi:hypothetical protein
MQSQAPTPNPFRVPKKRLSGRFLMAFWSVLVINTMLEPDEYLHERIQSVMLEVMGVLYGNNITLVHMGAMMRLLGVPDSKAAEHDNDMLELDETFGAMLTELNKSIPKEVPKDATIH